MGFKGVIVNLGDTPLNLGDTISEIRFQFLRYKREGATPTCLIFYVIFDLKRTPLALHLYCQILCNSAHGFLRSTDFCLKFTGDTKMPHLTWND